MTHKLYAKPELYTPSVKEEKQLLQVSEKISEFLRDLSSVLLIHPVGSYSRGTTLKKHRQIDYYLKIKDIDLFYSELLDKGWFKVTPRYRTKGLKYFEVTWGNNPRYKIDLVPYLFTIPERALSHTAYLKPRLNEELIREIRWSKFILKKVGLYNSDEKYRGFSGWAVQCLVYLYGCLEKVPEKSWISCPVSPERNLLGSVSPQNLERFHVLKCRAWRRNSEKVWVPNLYIYAGVFKEKSPLVRRTVILRDYSIVELKEVETKVKDQYLPTYRTSFKDCSKGHSRNYWGIRGLRVLSPQSIIKKYGLRPVFKDDFTNIRIYNYFK